MNFRRTYKRTASFMIVLSLLCFMIIGISSNFSVSQARIVPATHLIMVTSLSNVGSCPDLAHCSLQAAIAEAQKIDSPTMIKFSFSGTIMVPELIEIGTSSSLSTPTPNIPKTHTIIIDGSGQNIIIDGGTSQPRPPSGYLRTDGGKQGIFAIYPDAIVTFNKLTIEHGSVMREEGLGGGAIRNWGTTIISNSTLSGNSVLWGSTPRTLNPGILWNDIYYGGAIYNLGSMTIINSTLSGNYARAGGAIYNRVNATLAISNSSISSNVATGGSAIANDGLITISNSTLADNSSGAPNNEVGWSIGNRGTLNLLSTIVVGNNSPDHPDIYGKIISLGHNLIGQNDIQSGLTDQVNHDQVGTSANPINPQIDLLADNGGFTMTNALFTSSPAIGAGDCSGNLTVFPSAPAVTIDQRGMPRGSVCNIGAFEDQLPPHPTYTATPLTPFFTITLAPNPNILTNTGTPLIPSLTMTLTQTPTPPTIATPTITLAPIS